MDRGGALVGSDLEYDLLDLEIPSSHEYSATPHESYIFTVANRILFSKYYYLVYIVMFVAQTIFFIWGLVNHNLFTKVSTDDVWYIVFDVLITLLLAAEVIFRIIATHRTYWRSWLNRADFIMMLLCVSALLLYAVDPEVAIAGSLLLAVRYAVQICRVIITCKHHRDRTSMLRAMQGQGRIAFDDADDGMTSSSSIVTTQRNNNNGRTQSGKGLSSLSSPLMGDEQDMDAALALQNLVPVRSINSRLIRVTDEDREHAQLLSMYEEQAAQREQQQQQQRQKQMNGHTPSPSPSPPLPTSTSATTINGPPSPSNRSHDSSVPSHPTLQSQTSIHSFYSQSRVQNDEDEDADGL